jgi:RHS repeat-associated protein
MITFSFISGDVLITSATVDQDFLNGYVSTGFTNKVNNPKYNEFENTDESIDPICGAVSLRQLDASFSGRDGLNLEIARLYNSGETEILNKKAIYNVTDYFRCYEQIWNCVNGQWSYQSKVEISKRNNLTDAQSDYQSLYDSCANNPGYWAIQVYDEYFDAFWTNNVPGNYTVRRIYAPAYEPDIYKGTNMELKNYNVERYDLGIGWSLAFPSIEHAEAGYMYFHDGNGGTYRILQKAGTNNTYYLENYDANDISFTSASVGGYTKYYVDFSGQKKYTFNYDGTIEKISDRFGNRIKFEYVTRPVYNKVYPSYSAVNKQPFISKITDSVGRVLDFVYENKIDSGANNTIDLLSIYVTDPLTNIKKKIIEYKKRGLRTSYQMAGTTLYEFNYPVLDEIKKYTDDTNYVATTYLYEYYALKFDFWTKTSPTGQTVAPMLTKVISDTFATNYLYEETPQNLGNDGLCYERRCKQRYEILHDRYYYNTATNSWAWDTGNEQKLNVKNFQYSQMTYTGYPAYTSDALIPDDTQIWSSETDITGTSTKTIHYINNSVKRKRLYRVQKTFSDNSYNFIQNDCFDSTFPSKPTVVNRSYYDKNGNFNGESYYVYYTYNSWGAVESETKPIVYYNWNNTDYKDKRKTTYEYEPTFKLLKKKTWWQNDTTQLYEENTYDSLGRLITSRNAKGEIQTHDYVTVNGTYTGETTPFVAVTKETVKKALENSREEKSEIYYDLNKGSLPVKTIVYFSDDAGSKQSTVTMTYDMLYGLLKTKTEQGNTTTYNYDLLGREKSIKHPNFTDIDGKVYEVTENYFYFPGYCWDYNETASESYNGIEYSGIYGLVVESETIYSCNGVETKYNRSKCLYDAFGNLRIMKSYDPGTSRWIKTTKNIFDNNPRLIASIDANGNKISCYYDSYGNMSEIIDAYGNMNVIETVRHGFIAQYFVPAAKIQAFRQDPHYTNANAKYLIESYFNTSELLDRRVTYKSANRQNPLQETYKYDIAGNVIGYVDPKGNVNEDNNTKTYYYDALDRLIKVKNALNQIVDINYNINGTIDSVYARENDTATSKTEIYKKSYSEDGKLTSKTVGTDVKSNNQYNELGLVSTAKFKTLNATNLYYDELNRTKKTEIFNFSGTNLLQRISYLNNNPFGASEIRTSDNVMAGALNDKITIGYNYDAQITSKQVDYTENGVLESLLSTNQKNDIGLNTKSTATGFGNSYYTNYTYDKARLVKVQLDGNDAVNTSDLVNAKFTYNEDGKIDTIQYPVCVNNEYLKTKYNYNAQNKVLSVTTMLGGNVLSSEIYGYDNNGNTALVIRTISTDGTNSTTTTTEYTYDKLNRLETEKIVNGSVVTNKSYTYDLLGNRNQTSATYNFTLNEKEQIVNIPNTGGTYTSAYKYGQDGLRYQKTFNNKTYSYSYNIDGNLSKINDGTTTDNFTWANGRVYAKKDGKDNKTYYYIYNGFGDVIQLVDSNGNIVNSYTYDAWGNPTSKQETVSNPFRYRGYIYDDETGMYYLKARYYDPSYGRFLTEDTFEGEVDNLQSLNLYVYCMNNPLTFIDPSGKKISFWSGLGLVKGFIQGALGAIAPPAPWEIVDMIKGIGSLVTAVTSGDYTISDLASIGLDVVFDDFTYLKNHWDVIDGEKVASWSEAEEFGIHAGTVVGKVGTLVLGGGAALKGILTKLSNIKNNKMKSFVRAPGNIACFTAGTPVSTKDGQKTIEEIKPGDYVWSENPETGEKALKQVVKTFTHEKYALIHVYANDTIIETTEEHPFWVEGKGWTAASELNDGDILKLKSGKYAQVTQIKRIDLVKPVKVYNFEVEDWHTYFVSEEQVLVHNMCKLPTSSELADFARNSKKIDGLSGMKIPANILNDAAMEFIGKGGRIQKIDGGMLYISKDGLKTVRIGQKYGKGVYEANFETWENGKVIKNYHVEIQ